MWLFVSLNAENGYRAGEQHLQGFSLKMHKISYVSDAVRAGPTVLYLWKGAKYFDEVFAVLKPNQFIYCLIIAEAVGVMAKLVARAKSVACKIFEFPSFDVLWLGFSLSK